MAVLDSWVMILGCFGVDGWIVRRFLHFPFGAPRTSLLGIIC